eukprot:SAG31_NODE_16664_length_700_cov_8.866889_3_plen_31_part_01
MPRAGVVAPGRLPQPQPLILGVAVQVDPLAP